ncbi:cysteine-rich receptor-like protein kinase [Trifolium pratense]|uniref:Cysteine-rich receptor-like protein kinase n=1 Tax=Trifolium pratense TaxID=57577 RepID=A0A2K3PFA2_TRIPR|nr:cysteine-rich receptor-like protein kinase [Trifolium pratense]
MLPFKYSVIHSITFSFFSFIIFTTEASPIYNSHVCTNSSKDQPNTTFQTNLNILFSSLSSNATNGNHFYQTTVASETPNAVKGLFLCRGDTITTTCHDCVTAASTDLKRRCSVNKEAIIWYDVCTVRYSNNYLNNIVPSVDLSDSKSVTSEERNRFNELLARLLNILATNAANSDKEKFATGKVNFTRSVKIYGLVQCVPELSLFDCNMCLRSAIASVPNCCDGKQGARVLLPACNIRYELYLFYNSTTELITGPVSVVRRSGRCRFEVVLAFVVPIVAVMVFLGFGMWSVMRKRATSVVWRKTDFDEI